MTKIHVGYDYGEDDRLVTAIFEKDGSGIFNLLNLTEEEVKTDNLKKETILYGHRSIYGGGDIYENEVINEPKQLENK